MKRLLQLEELALFAGMLFIYPYFNLSWWWLIGCILLPDLGMVGYLLNTRTGAWSYNLFHHRGIAVVVAAIGYFSDSLPLLFTGYILLIHSAMDRILGYGLKYESGFRDTHLGPIGPASLK